MLIVNPRVVRISGPLFDNDHQKKRWKKKERRRDGEEKNSSKEVVDETFDETFDGKFEEKLGLLAVDPHRLLHGGNQVLKESRREGGRERGREGVLSKAGSFLYRRRLGGTETQDYIRYVGYVSKYTTVIYS